MMKKRTLIFLAAGAALALLLAGIIALLNNAGPAPECSVTGALPPIEPDYAAIVIPPNCAPLNFRIDAPASGYYVAIYGARGKHIALRSRSGEIAIPSGKWRRLLGANRGGTVTIDIYAMDRDRKWSRFSPITDTIAPDSIDNYLVYRLIPPLYTLYGSMGIYERQISSFDERPLWLNRLSDNNCMNCHTFKNNDPDYMIAHMRGGKGNGTLVVQAGRPIKVNTQTPFNTPAGFPAWHPGGNLIAFSVNTVRQFFHAVGDNREGFDKGSKIIVYSVSANTVTTAPALADPAYLTTEPEWSPDGRYLYYCRAPRFPPDSIAAYHEKIFYDLMRSPFDGERGSFGAPETVLSHEKTGESFSFPRISPDGRFLLCCVMPWGAFPVFRPGGDICLVDLRTFQYHTLDVNTAAPESFPSWSSKGGWIVFASKRIDGICARIYFSRVDANGDASKPFILPQRDPRFYEAYLKTYNLPELITKPVGISPREIVRTMYDNKDIHNAQLDATVQQMVAAANAAKAAAKPGEGGAGEPWRQQQGGTSH
jgi:hypothetical protein